MYRVTLRIINNTPFCLGYLVIFAIYIALISHFSTLSFKIIYFRKGNFGFIMVLLALQNILFSRTILQYIYCVYLRVGNVEKILKTRIYGTGLSKRQWLLDIRLSRKFSAQSN